MQPIKTVKVKCWGEGQGDYVEINECDYDKDKHTLHKSSSKPKKEEPTEPVTPAKTAKPAAAKKAAKPAKK